jgi:protein NRD1
LRGIFSAFGTVQTCIVNVDKRHAFVKMITRRDAMAAKEGMERFKSADMQLRVRAFFPPPKTPLSGLLD